MILAVNSLFENEQFLTKNRGFVAHSLFENRSFLSLKHDFLANFFFENRPLFDFQKEIGGTKNFALDLVGAPGRGTWWWHLVTNMSPPAPAGDPPGYPPHRPGT